ncbi:MAG: RluA family pseudouridine synthase [Bacteroidetes bacterium]|nr:RluA family pseudouridine synthase [Bacteroidota bacterium]
MRIIAKKTAAITEILLDEFGSASKTKIKKLITSGSISLEGKTIKKTETIITEGQTLEYTKYKDNSNKVQAPFKIVFEDEYLVAVIKPAGVLTHGDTGKKSVSLLKVMSDYVKEESRGKKRAFIIHRLDREVSGIILLAKSEEMMQLMKDSWQDTKKLYYALIEGHPEVNEGSIKSWLKESTQQKMVSVEESDDAKFAVTHFRILEKLDAHTLLEVNLETGRKNQIRVHFSEMGCPIVGDRRYGADDTFVRQIRLHAFSLSFTHPVTKELINLESKMPHNFLKLKEEDEKYK